MGKLNILNERYGRLVVIAEAENIKKRTAWLCRCDCGNEVTVKTDSLRSGDTKSCGCLCDEIRRTKGRAKYSDLSKYSHPMLGSANAIWKARYSDGDLTFDDFYELSQKNCNYCGAAPENSIHIYDSTNHSEFARKNGRFIYSGLDRLDSNLPHNKDNVVPCCKHCNYAKRDRSIKEFREWVVRVHETRIARKYANANPEERKRFELADKKKKEKFSSKND